MLVLIGVIAADYTGHLSRLHVSLLRSSPLPRFWLSLLGVVVWIAASASAWYTCDDLCALYPDQGGSNALKYATLCCLCSLPSGAQFGPYCDNNNYLGYPYQTYEQRTYRYEATQGLDITET
jgi:hypothetical protein